MGKTYDKDHHREYQRQYRTTLRGYFHELFKHMKERCQKQESYASAGIECKFESTDDLINYVTDVLQVDPRGLTCHRIDNDGHYEPGNIEFLTRRGHEKAHAEMRNNG